MGADESEAIHVIAEAAMKAASDGDDTAAKKLMDRDEEIDEITKSKLSRDRIADVIARKCRECIFLNDVTAEACLIEQKNEYVNEHQTADPDAKRADIMRSFTRDIYQAATRQHKRMRAMGVPADEALVHSRASKCQRTTRIGSEEKRAAEAIEEVSMEKQATEIAAVEKDETCRSKLTSASGSRERYEQELACRRGAMEAARNASKGRQNPDKSEKKTISDAEIQEEFEKHSMKDVVDTLIGGCSAGLCEADDRKTIIEQGKKNFERQALRNVTEAEYRASVRKTGMQAATEMFLQCNSTTQAQREDCISQTKDVLKVVLNKTSMDDKSVIAVMNSQKHEVLTKRKRLCVESGHDANECYKSFRDESFKLSQKENTETRAREVEKRGYAEMLAERNLAMQRSRRREKEYELNEAEDHDMTTGLKKTQEEKREDLLAKKRAEYESVFGEDAALSKADYEIEMDFKLAEDMHMKQVLKDRRDAAESAGDNRPPLSLDEQLAALKQAQREWNGVTDKEIESMEESERRAFEAQEDRNARGTLEKSMTIALREEEEALRIKYDSELAEDATADEKRDIYANKKEEMLASYRKMTGNARATEAEMRAKKKDALIYEIQQKRQAAKDLGKDRRKDATTSEGTVSSLEEDKKYVDYPGFVEVKKEILEEIEMELQEEELLRDQEFDEEDRELLKENRYHEIMKDVAKRGAIEVTETSAYTADIVEGVDPTPDQRKTREKMIKDKYKEGLDPVLADMMTEAEWKTEGLKTIKIGVAKKQVEETKNLPFDERVRIAAEEIRKSDPKMLPVDGIKAVETLKKAVSHKMRDVTMTGQTVYTNNAEGKAKRKNDTLNAYRDMWDINATEADLDMALKEAAKTDAQERIKSAKNAWKLEKKRREEWIRSEKDSADAATQKAKKQEYEATRERLLASKKKAIKEGVKNIENLGEEVKDYVVELRYADAVGENIFDLYDGPTDGATDEGVASGDETDGEGSILDGLLAGWRDMKMCDEDPDDPLACDEVEMARDLDKGRDAKMRQRADAAFKLHSELEPEMRRKKQEEAVQGALKDADPDNKNPSMSQVNAYMKKIDEDEIFDAMYSSEVKALGHEAKREKLLEIRKRKQPEATKYDVELKLEQVKRRKAEVIARKAGRTKREKMEELKEFVCDLENKCGEDQAKDHEIEALMLKSAKVGMKAVVVAERGAEKISTAAKSSAEKAAMAVKKKQRILKAAKDATGDEDLTIPRAMADLGEEIDNEAAGMNLGCIVAEEFDARECLAKSEKEMEEKVGVDTKAMFIGNYSRAVKEGTQLMLSTQLGVCLGIELKSGTRGGTAGSNGRRLDEDTAVELENKCKVCKDAARVEYKKAMAFDPAMKESESDFLAMLEHGAEKRLCEKLLACPKDLVARKDCERASQTAYENDIAYASLKGISDVAFERAKTKCTEMKVEKVSEMCEDSADICATTVRDEFRKTTGRQSSTEEEAVYAARSNMYVKAAEAYEDCPDTKDKCLRGAVAALVQNARLQLPREARTSAKGNGEKKQTAMDEAKLSEDSAVTSEQKEKEAQRIEKYATREVEKFVEDGAAMAAWEDTIAKFPIEALEVPPENETPEAAAAREKRRDDKTDERREEFDRKAKKRLQLDLDTAADKETLERMKMRLRKRVCGTVMKAKAESHKKKRQREAASDENPTTEDQAEKNSAEKKATDMKSIREDKKRDVEDIREATDFLRPSRKTDDVVGTTKRSGKRTSFLDVERETRQAASECAADMAEICNDIGRDAKGCISMDCFNDIKYGGGKNNIDEVNEESVDKMRVEDAEKAQKRKDAAKPMSEEEPQLWELLDEDKRKMQLVKEEEEERKEAFKTASDIGKVDMRLEQLAKRKAYDVVMSRALKDCQSEENAEEHSACMAYRTESLAALTLDSEKRRPAAERDSSERLALEEGKRCLEKAAGADGKPKADSWSGINGNAGCKRIVITELQKNRIANKKVGTAEKEEVSEQDVADAVLRRVQEDMEDLFSVPEGEDREAARRDVYENLEAQGMPLRETRQAMSLGAMSAALRAMEDAQNAGADPVTIEKIGKETCDALGTCPDFEQIKPNLLKNLEALKDGGERAKFKFVRRPEVDITVEAETALPTVDDIKDQILAMSTDMSQIVDVPNIKKVKTGTKIQSADAKTETKTTLQTGFVVPVKRGELEKAVKEMQEFKYDADGIRRRLAASDGEKTYATEGKEQVPGDEVEEQGKWWQNLPGWAVALIVIGVAGTAAIGLIGSMRLKKRKDTRKNTVVEPVAHATPAAPRYSIQELHTMIHEHPDMAIPAVRRQSMTLMMNLAMGPQPPSDGSGKVGTPSLPPVAARPSVAGW
jgi:hypothetical protein